MIEFRIKEIMCRCGTPATERCPWGFRLHVHCFLCGICTRMDDGTRRSCGGTSKGVRFARRARYNEWAKENLQ